MFCLPQTNNPVLTCAPVYSLIPGEVKQNAFGLLYSPESAVFCVGENLADLPFQQPTTYSF